MAVVSLAERLDGYVRRYLDEAVPEDLEAVYTTSVHERSGVCEHGDLISETVLWLNIWVTRLTGPEPGDQELCAYSVSGSMPAHLVCDGDMEPVDILIEEVWEKAQFGLVMVESGADLEEMIESEEDGS